MNVNAYNLLLSNNRFDLIFKYLYLLNRDKNYDFFSKMYLENIRAFNNFHEDEPSDGIPKENPDAFIKSFDTLFEKIKKNGYTDDNIIPIGNNGEISDGAHRLTCAAILKLDVPITNDGRNDKYDYKFFLERGFNRQYADYGAIEYVKLQKHSYIVNLHAVVDERYDSKVEEILQKYGRIYYKKKVPLNFNGYVNLKKLSYGSFWEREQWIGTVENEYAGAQDHAKHSKGNGKNLRAYVYICDNPDNLIKIKSEVRALFNIGNYCIHINDCHEEAVALAELFFDDNSIKIYNSRSFEFEDSNFDSNIEEFKNRIKIQKLNPDDFIIGGSSPLNILGIRKSDDIDFLYCGNERFKGEDNLISSHETELKYYPYSKKDLIYDNNNFFYYHGIKVISLEVLYKLKINRGEKPKDIKDCRLIKKILRENKNRKFKESIGNKFDYKSILLYRVLRKIYRKTFKRIIKSKNQ